VNEIVGLNTLLLYGVSTAAFVLAMKRIKARGELSLAKHRSLAGHPRMARRLAAMLPSYRYSDEEVFSVDGAPTELVAARRQAFDALVADIGARFPKSLQASADLASGVSDLQFISAYRIPFQFRNLADQGLKIASFVQSTDGVTLTDLDNNCFYDLTGSYGVNLFGNDFYKECIDEGAGTVHSLGPVLGSYHPVVSDNVARLKTISGMDEVSFHMSGTEAVMQAVRLARFHSGRDKIVRFCGSYHGWWGDVQPGIGNPVTERDTFTLEEMGQATLRVLRNRNDIACIPCTPTRPRRGIRLCWTAPVKPIFCARPTPNG
jgi:glutamate-1-semialdehyde 2,1-aminomutase